MGLPPTKAILLDAATRERETLSAMLAGLTREQLLWPGAYGWSAKDHVAHLAEWERTGRPLRSGKASKSGRRGPGTAFAARHSGGMMSTPDQDQDQDGNPGYGDCLRCGEHLEAIGIESFRVGGTSGGWKMLFGELAELGEGMLELEVFACPECRTVELRVPTN
jgi:hypothetical protein